jgi:hypothetical protein
MRSEECGPNAETNLASRRGKVWSAGQHGQPTSDGLAKCRGRRGEGWQIGLGPCRGLRALLPRHCDRPRGHITRQRSLMFCPSSGDSWSRHILRRQSGEGDCCFLTLSDLLLARLLRDQLTNRRQGLSFPRLCRRRLLRGTLAWPSMDRGLRDQEPRLLKTCDFRVKGCNNFLSIHAANILNHSDCA